MGEQHYSVPDYIKKLHDRGIRMNADASENLQPMGIDQVHLFLLKEEAHYSGAGQILKFPLAIRKEREPNASKSGNEILILAELYDAEMSNTDVFYAQLRSRGVVSVHIDLETGLRTYLGLDNDVIVIDSIHEKLFY